MTEVKIPSEKTPKLYATLLMIIERGIMFWLKTVRQNEKTHIYILHFYLHEPKHPPLSYSQLGVYHKAQVINT